MQNGLLQSIETWLTSLPKQFRTERRLFSEIALSSTLETLGYGAPFDHEQREINRMLVEQHANEFACLAVWKYYQDSKPIGVN